MYLWALQTSPLYFLFFGPDSRPINVPPDSQDLKLLSALVERCIRCSSKVLKLVSRWDGRCQLTCHDELPQCHLSSSRLWSSAGDPAGSKRNLLQTALNRVEGQIYFNYTSLLLAHDKRVNLRTALSLSAARGFPQITTHSLLCSR